MRNCTRSLLLVVYKVEEGKGVGFQTFHGRVSGRKFISNRQVLISSSAAVESYKALGTWNKNLNKKRAAMRNETDDWDKCMLGF